MFLFILANNFKHTKKQVSHFSKITNSLCKVTKVLHISTYPIDIVMNCDIIILIIAFQIIHTVIIYML